MTAGADGVRVAVAAAVVAVVVVATGLAELDVGMLEPPMGEVLLKTESTIIGSLVDDVLETAAVTLALLLELLEMGLLLET